MSWKLNDTTTPPNGNGSYIISGSVLLPYAAVPSIVVTSLASVPEGSSSTFTVKLSSAPAADVTVSVARSSGSSNLSVSGGSSLVFTTSNWNTAQTVTIASAEDNADTSNDTATITASTATAGISSVNIAATQADNDTGGGTVPNFTNFSSSTGLTLNGGAAVASNRLVLTENAGMQARSVYFNTKQNLASFTTNFRFQISGDKNADGFALLFQNQSSSSVGAAGGGLGYNGITPSAAIKFDFYTGGGHGSRVGLATAAAPNPATWTNTANGVDIANGNAIDAQVTYDGTTLSLQLTDTVTSSTWSTSFPVNLVSTVASQAWVGFSGGTGGEIARQEILSWSWTDGLAGGLPSPWLAADIGALAANQAGSSSYASGTSTWTINGGGDDIWGTADKFRYVYQDSSGDCSIEARVTAVESTDYWAKAGVMIRESTTPGARFVMVCQMPNNEVSMQWRTQTDLDAGYTGSRVGGEGSVKYVRLVRSGSTFTGSYKVNAGDAWIPIGTQDVLMATAAKIGLCVTAHRQRSHRRKPDQHKHADQRSPYAVIHMQRAATTTNAGIWNSKWMVATS